MTRPATCAEAPLTCGAPLAGLPFVLAPIGPNDPGSKVPCATPGGSPRIETTNNSLELGERRFFFACGLTDAITATVSSGLTFSRTVPLQSPPPNLDWALLDAERNPKSLRESVYRLEASPGDATGSYTVTFIRQNGALVQREFSVTSQRWSIFWLCRRMPAPEILSLRIMWVLP